jgi:hypothetical protein
MTTLRFCIRDWALLSTAAIAAALMGTAGLTAIEMAARWAAN